MPRKTSKTSSRGLVCVDELMIWREVTLRIAPPAAARGGGGGAIRATLRVLHLPLLFDTPL